jgi:hypothetical protein
VQTVGQVNIRNCYMPLDLDQVKVGKV